MKWWAGVAAALILHVAMDAAAAPQAAEAGAVDRPPVTLALREATPAPAAPAAAQKQVAPQPAGRTPAVPRSGWAGLAGSLAASLGLAWLAHALGLGAGFGEFLLLGLLALLVLAAVATLLRSRRSHPSARRRDLAFDAPGAPQQAQPVRQYSPDKVGNDASARPWERNSMAFEIGKVMDATAPRGPQVAVAPGRSIPGGFDAAGFVETARRNFVTLQDAWDRGDVELMRSFMSDDMMREIRGQLAARPAQGTAPARTEVVMLEARLLGIEERPSDHLASVEFSGMLREDPSAGPSPFREVWSMSQPKDGSSGWLVAGVQALG